MDSASESIRDHLTLDELQVLEERNFCRPSTVSSKRKVSTALLGPPTSGTGIPLASSSTFSASVRTRKFSASCITEFDMPISTVSPEALEFIGLVPSVAKSTFQRYMTRPDPLQNPDSLLDYVHGDISVLATSQMTDILPRHAMDRVGLIQTLQDGIMDPRFTDIFWTESLHYWVKDTLTINYATLCQLQQRLRNHSRGYSEKHIQGGIQPEIPPSPITTTVNMSPEDHLLPLNRIALQTETPLLPNHIILYKAKSPAEMMDGQWIQEDGSLDMQVIATYSGGDLNHDGMAWYWTPEREVAEHYRQWTALRCQMYETWLIRIQIPTTFINSLKMTDLWYSPNWKEYVWFCKRNRVPPAKFDTFWKDGGLDVIKSHICTGVSTQITRIRAHDVQEKITNDCVLSYGDNRRNATQYVFMQRDSVRRMGELIRGKIHIEITAATLVQDITSG